KVDVVYGRKHGMALTMDVFTPKSGANGAAIVWVFSCGWFSEACADSAGRADAGQAQVVRWRGDQARCQAWGRAWLAESRQGPLDRRRLVRHSVEGEESRATYSETVAEPRCHPGNV